MKIKAYFFANEHVKEILAVGTCCDLCSIKVYFRWLLTIAYQQIMAFSRNNNLMILINLFVSILDFTT